LTKVDNYYRSKTSNFLTQCIEVNVNKIVIKIYRCSVVTQTVLGELTTSSSCKFPVVYIILCQKLWKLVCSRQGYCNNEMCCFYASLCSTECCTRMLSSVHC